MSGKRVLNSCAARACSVCRLAAILLIPAIVCAARASSVRQVSADGVNLRAGPGPDYEVVAQVSRGALLQTEDAADGQWAAVVPPESVDLFVYAELVKDGGAVVDGLQIRGGPGINYKPVGRVDKGAILTIRGREGDWYRIAPPHGARLWISSEFLVQPGETRPPAPPAAVSVPPTRTRTEPVPVPLPTPESTRRAQAVDLPPSVPRSDVPAPRPWSRAGSAAATETPASKPAAVPTPTESGWVRPREASAATREAAPRVSAAPDQADTGIPVRYIGTVRPAGMAVWRRPSRYRLVFRDALGRSLTRCYIIADDGLLESKLGKQVELTGRETWVQGVRYPVVTAESVLDYTE